MRKPAATRSRSLNVRSRAWRLVTSWSRRLVTRLSACAVATARRPGSSSCRNRSADDRSRDSREGVLRLHDEKTEIFFVTIEKSARHFSPTTTYQDYAISRTRFHWQSQSTTSETSETGRRCVEQSANGWRFLLFVREGPKDPYVFLGAVHHEIHRGSRPMSIEWRLEVPIPAALLPKYATLLAA